MVLESDKAALAVKLHSTDISTLLLRFGRAEGR